MFTAQFTCVHGILHSAAVFQVVGINMYGNSNKTLSIDSEGVMNETESSNFTVDFSARFWVSQQAKDEGKLPMAFTALSGDLSSELSTFTLTDLDKPFEMDKADLVQAAEAHVKSMITQD